MQVENFSNIAKEEVISENFNDTPATEKAEEKAPQIERSGEEANHAIQNSKLRPIGDGSDYKKIGEADSEKTILEKQTDHENENVKEYSGSETTELETKDTFGKEQNLDENEEAKLKTESVETQDDTSKSQNSTQSQEEHKVTYNGVKILRVVIQNKEQRKMLKQLENNGGKL